MELEKKKYGWGGARPGAGRPKSSLLVSHIARPRQDKPFPSKVVLRIRSGLPSLCCEEFYDQFEKACLRARRFGLRIIHYALSDARIEMICEFKNNEQLEKSFKSLNTTLAIALKKIARKNDNLDHKGPVFLGRFHLTMLEEETSIKQALHEVLTQCIHSGQKSSDVLNLYSSAVNVHRWAELLGENKPQNPEAFNPDTLRSFQERALRITASPQFQITKSTLDK